MILATFVDTRATKWIVRVGLVIATFAMAAGCSTKGEIKEVMLPLAVVRKIMMDNVPGGLKKQSLNGREITGEYFNANNLDEPTDTARERAKCTIIILGSRRPYVISVSVLREKKIKGSKKKYDKLGEDSKLAKAVVKRLKGALANRPADINIIDEFRAF
ncbi:hypothetical protein BH10BDE1_BH10BDE1_22750 [soil metagenome]